MATPKRDIAAALLDICTQIEKHGPLYPAQLPARSFWVMDTKYVDYRQNILYTVNHTDNQTFTPTQLHVFKGWRETFNARFAKWLPLEDE